MHSGLAVNCAFFIFDNITPLSHNIAPWFSCLTKKNNIQHAQLLVLMYQKVGQFVFTVHVFEEQAVLLHSVFNWCLSSLYGKEKRKVIKETLGHIKEMK